MTYRNIRAVAILIALALLPAPAVAGPPARMLVERWLAQADAAANDAVMFDICGWGAIDLRTAMLEAALAGGVPALVLDELALRFDGMITERRRLEAVLALQPGNAPAARTTGLFATGGCAAERRGEILKRWGAMPERTPR